MKKLLILFAFLALAMNLNARNFVYCSGEGWGAVGVYEIINGESVITQIFFFYGNCGNQWIHTWRLAPPIGGGRERLNPEQTDIVNALNRAKGHSPIGISTEQATQLMDAIKTIESSGGTEIEIPRNMVSNNVLTLF